MFDPTRYTSYEYDLLDDMIYASGRALDTNALSFVTFIRELATSDITTYVIQLPFNTGDIPDELYGLEIPIEEVPLYINTTHYMKKIVFKWRMMIGH